MNYITKREIQIPETATKIELEDIKYIIYLWETENQGFIMKAFGGRRYRHDRFVAYKTEDLRQNELNKFIQEKRAIKQQNIDYKQAKKLREQEEFNEITPGDIFYTSWGYDQTNVSFYKLLKLKGKTGTFERLNSETVPGSEEFMSCDVKAGSGTGKEFTARFTGSTVKVDYGQRASKTTVDTSHYSSWYA